MGLSEAGTTAVVCGVLFFVLVFGGFFVLNYLSGKTEARPPHQVQSAPRIPPPIAGSDQAVETLEQTAVHNAAMNVDVA